MAIRIQLRRDTAANWTSANPVLLAGELGIETDTLKFKIGNGSNWNDITSYSNITPSTLESSLGDYILIADRGAADGVAALDSSSNLLVPGASIIIEGATDNAYETTLTVTDPTADRTITVPDASGTIVLADGSGNVSVSGNLTVNGTTTTVNSTEINVQTSLKFEGATADGFETTLVVVDPTADRTITLQDASGTLAHISNVNDAITTAGNDATTKANDAVATAEAYTDNEISVLSSTLSGNLTTHNNDTTNVHGILDTSVLATQSDIANHNSDTTSVHGIADTAQLATKTYADDAAGAVEDQLASYALVAGTTFTGNITAPTIYGTDVNVSDTLTANTIIVDGNLTVNGTTTTVHTADVAVADNLVYLNEAIEYAVTTVSGDGTNQTYTTSIDHQVTDAMVVRITGIDPSGYNKSSYVDVVSVTANTITVAGTETGTYVSGGAIFAKSSVNPDLGFVGGYNDGTYAHAGFVRDASDNGKWKLFEGLPGEPTSAVDFSTYTRSALEVGALFATGAAIGDVTNTELQYVHGVTSAIQTQLDAKAPIDYPEFTGVVTVSSDGIEFADGIQAKQGVPSITPISEKTSNYTLSLLSERDTMIEVNSSSEVTITIPAESAVAYPVGTSIDIMATNTGLVTIAGAGGVTVNATPGLKLRTQWSSATLFKRGSNSWVVYGDLKA